MRRPGVTGRQHEPPRAILDHLSCRAIDRLRGDDCVVLSSTMSLRTSVRSCSVIARFSSSAWNVKSGEYRAPVSRFRSVATLTDRAAAVCTVFLACGVPRRGRFSAPPTFSADASYATRASAASDTVPTADHSARQPGSPATPMRRSASQ